MKILLLFLIITSCALPPRYRNKSVLYQEKLKKCTTDLIGKYGVEAIKSVKVCKDIYNAK